MEGIESGESLVLHNEGMGLCANELDQWIGYGLKDLNTKVDSRRL